MSDLQEYGTSVRPASRAALADQPAVLTRQLVRRFGATAAVDCVDLTVESGEIYGFLGPNGAGKSTFIRMLCTLLRPTAGAALVAGHDIVTERKAVRRSIGAALQDAALDDHQTGRELLELQGRLYGLRSAAIRRRLGEVLDLVSIGDAIDRRIGTYSGGMKRRLDLAAALVHRPAVVFLDEPTTGLDPESRDRVWAEVRRLNCELGMTIFLTTQYLEEADALADRVGFISHGRIVAEGPPELLKRTTGQDVIVAEVTGDDPGAVDRLRRLDLIDAVSKDGTEVVITTSDSAGALLTVAAELARSRFRVTGLSLRTPTLDDVFRELTGTYIEAEVTAL